MKFSTASKRVTAKAVASFGGLLTFHGTQDGRYVARPASERLSGDWQRLGGDMRRAIASVSKEAKRAKA